MNIVTKTITSLPEEVCNIIYEYYKLPFLDEIQNPFNKYTLKHCWTSDKFIVAGMHVQYYNHFYNYPRNNLEISGAAYLFEKFRAYNGKNLLLFVLFLQDREILKKSCRTNGIEFKERTPTKNLIKKLMKL